jgi:hypothetical protein
VAPEESQAERYFGEAGAEMKKGQTLNERVRWPRLKRFFLHFHTQVNIYVSGRFPRVIATVSGQVTLTMHELNRLNGYTGAYEEDYARIREACGTDDVIFK